VKTREEVERGWRSVSSILMSQGQPELAIQIRRFVAQMLPVMTDKEHLAARVLELYRERHSTRTPLSR